MRNQLNFLAAAALAVGSVTFFTNAQDQPGKASRAGDNVDRAADIPAQLPAGVEARKNDDVEDIQSALAKSAEASLTKNGFDNLVGHFVDADRNRIGAYAKDKNRDWTVLNGRVDQFLKDWKTKYGQDFDVPHKVAFGGGFQGFTIAQGEIVNPQLLSNWPVNQPSQPANVNEKNLPKTDVKVDVKNDGRIDGLDKAGDKIVAGVDKTGDAIKEIGKPSDKPGDRNLEKGRNVAVVYFPMSHGAPALTVSMIHELPDTWKIDVPDNVSGEMLYNNLLSHLTAVNEMKDQWPADVNEGYRMVSHHVLMAVYGLPHK